MIGECERLDWIIAGGDYDYLWDEVDHSSFVGDCDLESIEDTEKLMKRDDLASVFIKKDDVFAFVPVEPKAVG